MASLRVLTTEQIARLYFPSAAGAVSSACRTRLRHLVGAGLLARLETPYLRSEGRRPFLYTLTARGRDLLVQELGLAPADVDYHPGQVGGSFLAHQQAVNEIYLSLSRAAPQAGLHVSTWVDERVLRRTHNIDRVTLLEGSRSTDVAVIPDAFAVLEGSPPPPRFLFFIEADRGTETVAGLRTKSFANKVEVYQTYFASEAILARYGTRAIRVLVVTTGTKRAEALVAAAEAVGARRRFWFTTAEALAKAEAQLLHAPIWRVASEPGMHALIPRP